MTTVTMGSTLSNPDLLTEQELREALHRANTDLINKDIQIHELRATCASLSQVVSALCELVLGKQWSALSAELSRLAINYKNAKAALARKMH